jgi:hypothetical protein
MSCSLCSLRQLLQFRPSRGKTHEVCNILGSRCTKPSKQLRVGGCWRYLYLYCKQCGDENTCYIIPMLIWCNVSPILVSPFLPANSVFYSWSFLCQIDTTQLSSHSASLTTVIGHGIGGKHIPIMARRAKARRWSKRWRTCLSSPDLTATQSSDGNKIQVRRRHVPRKDPTTSYVEYLTHFCNEYLGRACAVGTLKRISYEIHLGLRK